MEDPNGNTSKFNLTSKENFAETDSIAKTSCVRWRYVTAIVSFWAMLNSFWINGFFSVAIVSMTQPTTGGAKIDDAQTNANRTNGSHFLGSDEYASQETPEFEWDPQIQGILLGGFFWGLLAMQATSGVMVDRFGVKKVMTVGAVCTCIGALLGPVAARTHVYFFIATRLMSGIGSSVVKPVFITIVAAWYHKHERSRFMSFIFSGGMSGMALSMILTGNLCNSFPSEGWKWSFYIPGISVAVQLIFWLILVYNTPRDHPWISDAEISYIESESAGRYRKSKKKVIPWIDICKSKPFLAIVLNAFGQGWGFYTLQTQMPTYLKTILGFDLRESGIYAGLPYIASVVVNNTSSILADYLIKYKILRVVAVRNLFSLAGVVPSGICLLVITFLDNDPTTIYMLLLVGQASFGLINSGSLVNQIDLAPNYVGVLQGIIGSSMSISGIACSYSAGAILEQEGGPAQWNIVFYVTAGLLIGTVIIYVIFSEGELQSWNNSVKDSSVTNPETEGTVSVIVAKIENGTTLKEMPIESSEIMRAQ